MPEKMPSSFETATTLFGLVGLMAIAASAWLSGSLPMFTLAPGVSVAGTQRGCHRVFSMPPRPAIALYQPEAKGGCLVADAQTERHALRPEVGLFECVRRADRTELTAEVVAQRQEDRVDDRVDLVAGPQH